eukprot:2288723-Prymnesium_polylepis.1
MIICQNKIKTISGKSQRSATPQTAPRRDMCQVPGRRAHIHLPFDTAAPPDPAIHAAPVSRDGR